MTSFRNRWGARIAIPQPRSEALRATLNKHLQDLLTIPKDQLMANRYQKFRALVPGANRTRERSAAAR